MKNFVFISPNFPMTYWKFCRELKNNGMRVLGIGDCPYNELLQELRDSLHEYYKVSSLENSDEVFKAVAFFTFKYGKIDWLESNNEYWLMRDAWLRTEFNITTGPKLEDMDKIKYKSAMKEYYAKAGLPTARWHIVEGLEDALEFAHTVGYAVVVKHLLVFVFDGRHVAYEHVETFLLGQYCGTGSTFAGTKNYYSFHLNRLI